MWRFRWRARLRRFNSPFAAMNSVTSLVAGAEAFRNLSDGLGTTGFQNALLQLELATTVSTRFASGELIIH